MSEDFIEAVEPTVAIVSNGGQFGHPRGTVVERISAVSPSTEVYLTNRNTEALAWTAPAEFVADEDLDDLARADSLG